jgi:hypothetical protein
MTTDTNQPVNDWIRAGRGRPIHLSGTAGATLASTPPVQTEPGKIPAGNAGVGSNVEPPAQPTDINDIISLWKR